MPTNGKRIAYGRNQVRVPIATYPDDTSVPVRTSHWNQDPHDQAILGFTKITATLDSSGVIYTKDDSSTTLEDDGNTYSRQSTLIEVECEGTTTTDVIVKIDITDTNENDIIYLYKGTDSDAITIASGTPSVEGHIKTQLSGGATLVHDGVPIMLIRRGDYWYEFGADGAAVTPYAAPTIGSTSIASGSTNATIAGLTLTTPDIGTPSAGTLTDCDGLPAAGVVGTAAILGANTFTADQTITEAGTAEIIRFRNQSLDGQFIAKDTYKNLSSTSVERIIAQNIIQTTDYTNGAEDGTQRMYVMENGTLTEYLNIQGAGAKIIAYKPLDMSGTDIDNVQNVIHDISATGLDIDFSEDQLQTYPTLTGNVTFTTFQNIVAGKSKTIRLLADATDRECTFPSGIKWVGTAPTSNVHTVTASKYAIITFTSFGTTEAEIIGAFAVEE